MPSLLKYSADSILSLWKILIELTWQQWSLMYTPRLNSELYVLRLGWKGHPYIRKSLRACSDHWWDLLEALSITYKRQESFSSFLCDLERQRFLFILHLHLISPCANHVYYTFIDLFVAWCPGTDINSTGW